MVKLAVFVSGGGTNLQEIINAIAKDKLDAEITSVISDTKNAYALSRAKKANIPSFYIEKGTDFFKESMQYIKDTDYLVLAGFLSILPADFCKLWTRKIINIHPSLLPKYGGKGMYGHKVHQAVIDNKEIESGATVHWVTEEIDGGDIITQGTCKVEKNDTADSLAERIHKIEYRILIEALQKIVKQNK